MSYLKIQNEMKLRKVKEDERKTNTYIYKKKLNLHEGQPCFYSKFILPQRKTRTKNIETSSKKKFEKKN